MRYTDPSINAFTKTNLYYTKNDLLKYQDPTYLGFKLFMLFDQPESGLLSEVPHPNTALGYLIRRGETERAGYLVSFVKLLKRINSEAPWFFQGISGLDEAWKHGYNETEFKAGLPSDRKISIDCLDESIDLRMTALMDLYRKACFDWNNRREVVPRNLRYFSVSIYVYESRRINRWGFPFPVNLPTSVESLIPPELSKNKREMDKLLGKDPLESTSASLGAALKDFLNPPNPLDKDTVDDGTSRVMFNFSMCEFLPDESNTIVSDVKNSSMDRKSQRIVFNYRNVTESNVYRMFHDKTVSDMIINSLDGIAIDNPALISGLGDGAIAGVISEQGDRLAKEAANRATSELKRLIGKYASGLFLGNVYGFSGASVANITSQGINGVTSSTNDLGDNASMRNDTKSTIKGGNVY